METEILCLADYASFDTEGKLSITGIFDSFSDKNFPTTHDKCYAVAKIRLDSNESGVHNCRIAFVDDHGDALATAEAEVSKQIPENESGTIMIIASMENLPLPYPATYSIRLQVGVSLLKSIPITTRKVE